MHICFLSHEYPLWSGGGIGTFTQTLASSLVAHGLEVTVIGLFAIDKPEVVDDQGVAVHRIPAAKKGRFRFYRNAKAINAALHNLHACSPLDILESAELGLAFIDRSLQAKKIIRLHGGHHFFSTTLGGKPALWRGWQEKRSFGKSDALVAVSDFVGRETLRLLDVKDKDYRVIFNPVNPALFRACDPAEADSMQLLFYGTLCEKKGVRQLIQAMPMVRAKYPDVRLTLIGRDSHDSVSDGSYWESLSGILPSDHESYIRYLGPVPHNQLPGHIAKAAVCVFPSHMESFGLMVAEAMAMQKPVIFGQYGPGPEIVKHGETGLLCDSHDPKDIARHIIRMLDDPISAQEMAYSAREDVIARFSLDQIVLDNINFYKECLTT